MCSAHTNKNVAMSRAVGRASHASKLNRPKKCTLGREQAGKSRVGVKFHGLRGRLVNLQGKTPGSEAFPKVSNRRVW